MSSHHPEQHSTSDSEIYDHLSQNDVSDSPSPPSTSSSPLILYKPPTLWGLLRGAVINLFLPFVNGLMLGFGELVANEAAFRLGWSGTKVWDHCGLETEPGRKCADVFVPDISYASRRIETGGAGCRDARRSGGAEEEKWRGAGYLYGSGIRTRSEIM